MCASSRSSTVLSKFQIPPFPSPPISPDLAYPASLTILSKQVSSNIFTRKVFLLSIDTLFGCLETEGKRILLQCCKFAGCLRCLFGFFYNKKCVLMLIGNCDQRILIGKWSLLIFLSMASWFGCRLKTSFLPRAFLRYLSPLSDSICDDCRNCVPYVLYRCIF